ncbi:MAG: hypothetical protein ACT443_14660 [Gemmatimonadota bacterium]
MNLANLIAEIQRRHVGRVAGVYAVVGWIIIQVAATVFPLLEIPDLATRIVVIVVIAGLPIALALAWAFDLTAHGLKRTEALPETAARPAPDARYYARAMGYFGVGILVALVAFAALARVRTERGTHTAAGIRLIAVLPFEDMSQKGDQAYFSNGIAEELLNRLCIRLSMRSALKRRTRRCWPSCTWRGVTEGRSQSFLRRRYRM